MHLLLTDATGLVGSAVLHHMLTLPSITQITILSRRPVPQAEGHTKTTVVIHEDFGVYGDDVLGRLKGAEGWCGRWGLVRMMFRRSELGFLFSWFGEGHERNESEIGKKKGSSLGD
jgi:hypothetical protein